MRDLIERQDVDTNAKLAIEMFCYRARKYLGAYMAILNGVDCITFGGGIGENAPQIRKRICDEMSWCGLLLDEERNQLAHNVSSGGYMKISTDTSKITVYVVAVNEAQVIAEDARTLVLNNASSK
jgi:acetate kinase